MFVFNYFYVALLKHLFGEVVWVVSVVDDFFDAGVDEHFGADDTGGVGAVEDGVFDGDAEYGCLYDGVLFGVEAAAYFVSLSWGDVHLFAEAADFGAVFESFGCAVVSGAEDVFVFDEDGADLSSEAGAAGGDEMGHFHEVFVVGWSFFGHVWSRDDIMAVA